jgi:hypothetical protein
MFKSYAVHIHCISIAQIREVLAKGGFSLKFVAPCGELPPGKASFDGRAVGALGRSRLGHPS